MRYAVVENGGITNVVEWDGDTARWNPPTGSEAVPDPDGLSKIGGTYADGIFTDPPEPEPTVPDFVSPRQLKLALYGAGLLENIEAFVAQAERPVQISWEYAVEFRRDDPLLNQMAAMLGMDDAQVDGLFHAAASL